MNSLTAIRSISRINISIPVIKFSTRSSSAFSSFFQNLNEKYGVGKQFEREQEKQLWGNNNNTASKNVNLITHWKTFNDSEYGGLSKSSFTISESSQIVTFKRYLKYDDKTNVKQEFMGGYCAITGYCANTVDLMDYAGIEILIKTSKPCSFLFR